jgi:hypothetical protein
LQAQRQSHQVHQRASQQQQQLLVLQQLARQNGRPKR